MYLKKKKKLDFLIGRKSIVLLIHLKKNTVLPSQLIGALIGANDEKY